MGQLVHLVHGTDQIAYYLIRLTLDFMHPQNDITVGDCLAGQTVVIGLLTGDYLITVRIAYTAGNQGAGATAAGPVATAIGQCYPVTISGLKDGFAPFRGE